VVRWNPAPAVVDIASAAAGAGAGATGRRPPTPPSRSIPRPTVPSSATSLVTTSIRSWGQQASDPDRRPSAGAGCGNRSRARSERLGLRQPWPVPGAAGPRRGQRGIVPRRAQGGVPARRHPAPVRRGRRHPPRPAPPRPSHYRRL
ncbi:MAG: acetyltransferase, partial [uncultured Acidimicrobiales bacterium]